MRAREIEARIARLYPPLGQLVPVQGGVVHVVQRGAGPDIVLLHGAGTNLRDFPEALVAALAQSFRVTLMDRPGCGHTARLKRIAVPKAQAVALSQAADALGLRAPIVVGHSYGATVATAWALCGAALPVRPAALVLIAGPLMPAPFAVPWLRGLAKSPTLRRLFALLATSWTPSALVRRFAGRAFAPAQMPRGYLKYSAARLTLRRANLRAVAKQLSVLAPSLRQLGAELPDLALPVELLHGTADAVVPHEGHSVAAARLIPGARLTLLLDRGHMIHHTDPKAMVDAVTRAALALPA
ncbi:MAG: alpha/beta hydrolase [Rhodobacteraceae bacterium]|nr:alpha/beta hydrolase [Paracoccaceae bacterium]